MLARIWNGIASQDQADSYVKHFHETVLPELRAITGFQRAYLLRREHQNETQFTVFTLWEHRPIAPAGICAHQYNLNLFSVSIRG
jgi:heme-degrading monooxygenase HmoA